MAIALKKKEFRREDSFLSLVTKNQEKLYRIAYSYVKNKDDALDIVQESVYKAYISYHKVKEKRYENTWLVRIVINTSIDFLKKNNKVIALDMGYMENMKDSKSENIHTKVIVEEALDKLNEKQKTVVILRYFEDMKLEDIASILDAPVSTIKTTLYRALKDMKVNLKE